VVVLLIAVGGYIVVRSSHAAGITGDINGDGTVNVYDLSILLSHWNANYAPADLNSDGTVSVFDLSVLLSHWSQSTASSPTPTTTPSSSNCTNPIWSTSNAEGTQNFGDQTWWVGNDAWNGSHGPQSIYACSPQSWYAVSNQPDIGGAVETYPDTEYDVNGRDSNPTKTIAQYTSITSTFSENFPSAGSWDAAYDLWTNNWGNETMIWNQWSGGPAYWPSQATIALTLNGVPYHFYALGKELMFFRDTQVTSGSVDILAAYQWEVANGYAKATDVPTQLEYGVEVCATNGNETFPMTGITFNLN